MQLISVYVNKARKIDLKNGDKVTLQISAGELYVYFFMLLKTLFFKKIFHFEETLLYIFPETEKIEYLKEKNYKGTNRNKII